MHDVNVSIPPIERTIQPPYPDSLALCVRIIQYGERGHHFQLNQLRQTPQSALHENS
jgi:hypothetical protein